MSIKEYLNDSILPNHVKEAKEVHVELRLQNGTSLIVTYKKAKGPKRYLFTFKSSEDLKDFEIELANNPGLGYNTVRNFEKRGRVTIEPLNTKYTPEDQVEIDRIFKDWHSSHS